MEEKHQKIIESAAQTFMRFGLRSVTMDDVAKNAGISKKTLYQVVSDKTELVMKVMEHFIHMEETQICCFTEADLNAIDEMIGISKHVSKTLAGVHPSIHYDMEKYFPDAWKMFQNFKTERIYNTIKSNLNRGVQQGLYRNTLNSDIIARIYILKMDMLFDPVLFPPTAYNLAEVYLEFIRYHIRGIASEQGRQYLKEKITKGEISLY